MNQRFLWIPSTAVTLRQESLTTLRRGGPKIISTNLTATWPKKCQGCPDPFPPSAPTKVTWKVTSNLTVRVTVNSVSRAVTLAVTLTVRPDRRTGDLASGFRLAPAPLGTLSDTPPRPLIPPSQPRREGSGAGVGKTIHKNGAGARQISTIRNSIRLQQKGHCGGKQ